MDQTITQADLAGLARKIEELADVLTGKERELLLAVFALAGQTIKARVGKSPDAGGSESESAGDRASIGRGDLSAGFTNAFQPIGSADFNLRSGIDKVAGGVGIGVIW